MLENVIKNLQYILDEKRIYLDEPMSKHTTMRVGGPADVLVCPSSREEIKKIIELCRNEGVPFFVMGAGSNLLVRDGGIRGVVLELSREYREFKIEGTAVTAAAGVRLSGLCRRVAEASLTGLEFAEGIPGSLGGAIFMNAGAYGGEISQVVERVISLDTESGQEIEREREELAFGYRQSCYQHLSEVILEAVLRLRPGKIEDIESTMQRLAKQRREKQPLDLPSAGSAFRRPKGVYVGPLLDELGLKGFQVGGAKISEKHAGFIVNVGGATAADVLQLIEIVRERVRKERGFNLEPEIQIVGEG